MCDITYVPREGLIVHLPDRDMPEIVCSRLEGGLCQ